jgi:pentose-5-phosphate-3-epimerase
LTMWLAGFSAVSCAIAAGLAEFGGGSVFAYSGWRLALSPMALGLASGPAGLRFPLRSRQLGVAVYANPQEDIVRILQKVGNHFDHLHVDLVDETVCASADAVDLGRLSEARRYWPGLPVCLHVMSRRPRGWVEQTWDEVDWYLLPCDSRDDLSSLMSDCRERGKRVGIVWQQGFSIDRMTPYLSLVDFVMVMGIARLGVSGQTLCEDSVAAADRFDRLRRQYNYELMFDGGVNVQNAARIPGRYLVSASGVLASAAPKASAELLRWSQIPSAGGGRAA